MSIQCRHDLEPELLGELEMPIDVAGRIDRDSAATVDLDQI
jgi:hypothetical protein